jgi:large subunit ribosomal protein L13
MNPHRKSYVAKPAETNPERGWWVIDAAGIPLGRLASVVATRVRGKHKPTFTPHVDTGDFVVVVNAAKTKLTGRKLQQKKYYRHSAYPGGLKQVTYDLLMENKPEFAVLKAVRGMLPKNRLGRQLIKKVKVYAGPDHPHTAQQPQPLELRT